MSLSFFAHGGEVHETQAEETAHASQAGTTLPLDIIVGGGALLAIVLFWVVATYALKLKLATKLLIIMAALLVVGVTGYQSAPVTSTIALGIGFALALGGMFLQLMPARRDQNE